MRRTGLLAHCSMAFMLFPLGRYCLLCKVIVQQMGLCDIEHAVRDMAREPTLTRIVPVEKARFVSGSRRALHGVSVGGPCRQRGKAQDVTSEFQELR